MSDAATKTCSKCGEVKVVELFRRDRNQCIKCIYSMAAKRRLQNKEKFNAQKNATLKKRIDANPQKYREQVRLQRSRNIERIRASEAKYRIKNAEELRKKSLVAQRKRYEADPKKYKEKARNLTMKLSNCYIKALIRARSGIPAKKITQELIEVKRKHLQILRAIKETTNERQSKNPRRSEPRSVASL